MHHRPRGSSEVTLLAGDRAHNPSMSDIGIFRQLGESYNTLMKKMLYLAGFILSVVSCFSAAAQVKPESGEEWLSWTPVQRSAYVYGLVSGYLIGFHHACNLADQLFETDKPHRLGDEQHPTDAPSGRCLAHLGEFSKPKLDKKGHPDISAYTDVITAFYEAHIDCRDFPFPFLLQSIGTTYATADQLYDSAVKGKLEGYPRSREWCNSGNPPTSKPQLPLTGDSAHD